MRGISGWASFSAPPRDAVRMGSVKTPEPITAESPTACSSTRNAPMNRRERRATGPKSEQASIRSGAATPAALVEAGQRHLQAGRHLEAQLCCQQAIAADPNHTDSLRLMALLSLRAKQYDHAIEWAARAIRIEPRADHISTLGTALLGAGRIEEALRAFDKAVSLEPTDAEHWKKLGAALIDLNRPDEALLSLRRALDLRPHYADAANLSGLILYRKDRFAEALAFFDISVHADPDQADALHLRALMLQKLGRLEESAADGLRSAQLDPTNADTHNNLGSVLHELGRFQESLTCYDRALAVRSDYLVALNNKAHLLADMLRLDEALACYEKSLTIKPDDPIALWNVALIDMSLGNFEAGWAGREIRWKTGLGMKAPNFIQPQWLGDRSIDGKTILLFADEGIGDCFQFARYLPMVAELGAKIILAVQESAVSLLSRMPGVVECIPKSTTFLPAFDLYCSISSLPLAFGTRLDSIPATVPYLPSPLAARTKQWEQRLGSHDRLRVGLVWSGNPGHANDRNRSLPLQMLASIPDVDARFVSLQKNPRASDQEILGGWDVLDIADQLSDFDETATLIGCLDLIITVDTSVAHLAGGLGRPVWILLPYRADYRWLLDRADSPWYPTARLFRQDERRDYRWVVDQVRGELADVVDGFREGLSPSYGSFGGVPRNPIATT
jgi:tetratricopeptide (TPR) repeat protein